MWFSKKIPNRTVGFPSFNFIIVVVYGKNTHYGLMNDIEVGPYILPNGGKPSNSQLLTYERDHIGVINGNMFPNYLVINPNL